MENLTKMNEEILLLRKSIKSFAEVEVNPNYDGWRENGVIPRSLWEALGRNGFLCVDIPEKYGGLGGTDEYSMAIIDEFSRLGYAEIAGNLSVHSNIVAHYILNSGSEEQKKYYLPKMASGEFISAIAMTEPGTGSDLQGIKTSAVKVQASDKYVINGSKTFISNGQSFDFVVVVAKTNPDVRASQGMSLFIVDADEPGLEKGTNLKKIGLHAADTSELFLENVTVSSEQLLGELDQGFITLMNELPRERITLAVGACGAMEWMIDMTKRYLHEREAFGRPLSDIQVIRHHIADMVTEAKVNRAYINQCLTMLNKNELSTVDASMAKLSSTEAQGRIADTCLQLFGGYGYMDEYPISRAFVDARVQRIYGGTSEIMKEIISKAELDQ